MKHEGDILLPASTLNETRMQDAVIVLHCLIYVLYMCDIYLYIYIYIYISIYIYIYIYICVIKKNLYDVFM
jgi:hypothetical protein